MKTFRQEQGAIMTAGITLISVGGAMLATKEWMGLALVAVGATLVFWREWRKD